MNEFLQRERIFRGNDVLDRLRAAHVTIAGVGTLGSHLAETLTRQGISQLRLIDHDRVESHNLGPQIYGMDDVGALKVEAARNRIFANVEVEVEALHKEMKNGNIKRLLRNTDLVIDAFDNYQSRQLLFEYCTAEAIECLHLGMLEGYGEVVWNHAYHVPADSPQDICDYPLARNLAQLVVAVGAEEIINFLSEDRPRRQSWSITLADLTISSY